MLGYSSSLTSCKRKHPPSPPSKGDLTARDTPTRVFPHYLQRGTPYPASTGDLSEDVHELCCRVTILHRIYEEDDLGCQQVQYIRGGRGSIGANLGAS